MRRYSNDLVFSIYQLSASHRTQAGCMVQVKTACGSLSVNGHPRRNTQMRRTRAQAKAFGPGRVADDVETRSTPTSGIATCANARCANDAPQTQHALPTPAAHSAVGGDSTVRKPQSRRAGTADYLVRRGRNRRPMRLDCCGPANASGPTPNGASRCILQEGVHQNVPCTRTSWTRT